MRSYRSEHMNVCNHDLILHDLSLVTPISHARKIPNSNSHPFSSESLSTNPLLTVTTGSSPSNPYVYSVFISLKYLADPTMMGRGPVCQMFYLKDDRVPSKCPYLQNSSSRYLSVDSNCNYRFFQTEYGRIQSGIQREKWWSTFYFILFDIIYIL